MELTAGPAKNYSYYLLLKKQMLVSQGTSQTRRVICMGYYLAFLAK